MRNSNKVLLIAAAVLLAFVLSFVLVMGLTARNLFERHGRTAQADIRPAEPLKSVYCLAAASSTMDLSFSSTALPGNCNRASSSTARASS
jgi:hypothetical protein